MVPPGIAGLIAAFAAGTPALAALLGVAFVWYVAAALIRVAHARKLDAREECVMAHEGLVGAAHVLHACAAQLADIPGDSGKHIRVTIHRLVPLAGQKLDESKEIEQLIDYVSLGAGRGRRFNIAAGVCGTAIRRGRPCCARRRSKDDAAYLHELRSRWLFSPAEARAPNLDRRLFMAVPIRSFETVVGVVYLDSDLPDLFRDPKTAAHWIACCHAVTRYVQWRYQ